MPDQAGPVATLIDALTRRDLTTISWIMAADVVLSVPSMKVTCNTAMEATAAMAALLEAFPDLDYQVRSRYIAPGQVTDEVTLHGTQSGMLFGRRPTGRTGAVNGRILITHDGVVVRSITLWVDQSAVRVLVGDDSGPGTGGGTEISALRATIPQEPGRVIEGHRRTSDSTLLGAPLTPAAEPGIGSLFLNPDAAGIAQPQTAQSVPTPSAQRNHPLIRPGRPEQGNQRLNGRGFDLKSPMPRNQRQRLAILAGSSMLIVVAIIVGWVGQGAWKTTQRQAAINQRLIAAGQTPTPAPTQAPAPSPAATTASPEPSPTAASPVAQLGGAPTVIPDTNVADIKSVVGQGSFFESGKSQLTPEAQRVLRGYCRQIRTQKRFGLVIVKAWADQRGNAKSNLVLSQSRADAVSAYMFSQLANFYAKKKVRFKAIGGGISTQESGTGAVDKYAANRRIQITFPPPRGTKASTSPSVSATA